MPLIYIEHQHGAGGTHHAHALAANLTRHGVTARPFVHRPPPMGCARDLWSRVLHHATERAALAEALRREDELVVMDRGPYSTHVVGHTPGLPVPLASALVSLAHAEYATLPDPALVLVLDAPDATLDARILTRGVAVTDTDRDCREVYRRLARRWGAVVVDTDRPVEVVEAEILALALRALEVAG